jgi:hypothetical protein
MADAVLENHEAIDTEGLAFQLLTSLAIGLLTLVLSPWGSQCWWPAQTYFPKAIFGFGYFMGLPSLWIIQFASCCVALGRRGMWLLLFAPLGLLPCFLTAKILVDCLAYGTCSQTEKFILWPF